MSIGAIIANFQTFKLGDLVDIIIVAFALYHLLGFINRSRAGQLAMGAAVILMVYVVAVTANLRMVKFIMQQLFQIGFLAIIIIFHPEIRRALERMGQTDRWMATFFHSSRHVEPGLRGRWRSAILAICDAAERLSESQTGALIVLERHTNLSEIIRTGTVINSDVNPEMLGTIFYEGTPLHDGAVVIQNGKVKAAGCVLPLSNNLDFGKDMGTRHRAGLGIAENSDAIAIIVSEETGIISMAKNGVLMRHLDRQSLFTRLQEEMLPQEADASTAKRTRRGLQQLKEMLRGKPNDKTEKGAAK